MPQQTGRVVGAKKRTNARALKVPPGGLQPGSQYEKVAAGKTPSLVPARAAPPLKGILKNPTTANVQAAEQKQEEEAGEEDPSALNESEWPRGVCICLPSRQQLPKRSRFLPPCSLNTQVM